MAGNPGRFGLPRSTGVGANRIIAAEPMSLLARFITANQRLCEATDNQLPAVFGVVP
jgi:hypothetical protein